VALAWVAAGGLAALTLSQGKPLSAVVGTAAPVAACALLAGWGYPGRRVRTLAGSAALIAAAALLDHALHGRSEALFSFFVVVGVLALYQDWQPFALTLVFVIAHIVVNGATGPALMFAGFLLAAGVASIVNWRSNEHQFLREPLTGLPGRAVFNRKLESARGERPEQPVTVMLIDLDGFKALNDSRGHRAGDELLAAVAVRLAASVRPRDTVSRVGGDEFGVLCEGLGASSEALAVAERIRERLRAPYRLASEEVSISASVGVAISAPGQSAESLLTAADAAMYRAKHHGGDACWLYDRAVATELSQQHRTEAALRRALDEGRIKCFYQPVVSLGDGEVVGWEALARWRAHRAILPSEFIPAAEASGLVVPLGEAVLRRACRDLAAQPKGFVSVNVSGRQLARPEFADLVGDVLSTSGIKPERLCLEITETVLLDFSDIPIRTLDALKAMGIKIALDDFGTGQSSLAYLRRLPLDVLKLDRSFIEELDDIGRDVAIVSAVVDLARSLKLTVVAEGVETDKQAACLRALDCQLAQGFLFSPARPAMERPEPGRAYSAKR
jgi:diguanylate cyclase (GGDEF)-like protein